MNTLSKTSILLAILAAILVSAAAAAASDDAEYAPIIETEMVFRDFTLKRPDGAAFNLRNYLADRRVVVVSYIAGWCKNSNQNGHVIKRLYDKYKDRGLGVVAVTEYSDPGEISIHVNRIGIDYPVVTETTARDARKKSAHYRYRMAAGDRRKWGTPFYVIIDARNVEPAAAGGPLARRVYTVSGELVESEAESFLDRLLSQF